MPQRILISLLFVITSLPFASHAQTCAPPQIVFNSEAENIFTPEQEMMLGDVMFERAASEFQVIDDPKLTAYLQAIGDRITRNLPDVGLKYKFFLIDMPETNALTLAGGRIMITRKMVSFARNEDELAAVIGHELGHAVVRHSAIDASRYFKELLGVTSVTDRNDIFEKYNRFLESRATRRIKVSRNHSDNKQIEADTIGIYAAYAAGYDPTAFADFWSRLTDAEERGMFSRLFGLQTPDDKRLREMVGALKTIPAECRQQISDKNKENEDFAEWRQEVVGYTGIGEKEVFSGLEKKIKLAPLRSEIQYLRFSPNGQYLVAQDYTSITVLQREPLAVLFRIDAVDTLPATFSADSQKIIARSSYDRVQTWNIVRKELESVYEFAEPSGTEQSAISPDGKNVVVFKTNGDLSIYDIASGTERYFDEKFYVSGGLERPLLPFMRTDTLQQSRFGLIFSEDGRYVVLGRRFPAMPRQPNKYNPFAPVTQSFVRSPGNVFHSKSEAIDLRNYQKVKIGRNVENILFNGGAFIDNGRLVGKISHDIDASGIFAFPTGERMDKFPLSGVRFVPSYTRDNVMVRPVANAPAAIYSFREKRFIVASVKAAIDAYGDVFASELPSGELAIFNIRTGELISKTLLPASPLGSIKSISLSDDGNKLALSENSRGVAWDLTTGKPLFGVPHFRGSYISPDGKLYADFPEDLLSTRKMPAIDLKTLKVEKDRFPIPDGIVRQYGKYILVRSSKLTDKFFASRRSNKEPEQAVAYAENVDEPWFAGYEDVTFRLMDSATGKTLWTREFDDEIPNYILNTAHDTLTFYWRADRKAAKKLIGSDPKLKQAAKADDASDYDVVAEIVDPASGNVRDHFLINTGEGSFTVTAVWASGDYLSVVDDSNRTLVYSISSGKLLQRFFGSDSDISVEAKLIAVENPTGWINIYDLDTGVRKERLGFTSPLVFLDFLDDGQKLFVLTADQVAYVFDTTKFTGKNLKRAVTATP